MTKYFSCYSPRCPQNRSQSRVLEALVWSRQGVSQSPALLRATVTICVTAGIDGGSRNAPRGSNSSQSCDALRRLESCSHKATRCERQHRSNAARCDVPLDYLDKRNRLCSTATPRALHCTTSTQPSTPMKPNATKKHQKFVKKLHNFLRPVTLPPVARTHLKITSK